MLDVYFSLTGILIFGQQILNISGDWRRRCKEHRDAHFAFQRVEETLGLIRERIFLIA